MSSFKDHWQISIGIILLFIANIALLGLLQECQMGNEWEVGQDSVLIMSNLYLVAVIMSVIVTILTLISFKKIFIPFSLSRLIYLLWYIAVVAIVIYIIIQGGPIDIFRITELGARQYLINHSFIYGFINLFLCIFLIIGVRIKLK